MIVTPKASVVTTRRALFVAVNIVVYLALLVGLRIALGHSALADIFTILAAIFAPWTVLSFTTGLIGAWQLFAGPARSPASNAPIVQRTAIVMTIRNEDPARALKRLRIIQDSLDASGWGQMFGYHVLSDTSEPAIALAEEAAIAAWPDGRVSYRRRAVNTGYKAGNVMEFCRSHCDDFAYMITLDADSLMTADAILPLVRLMQDNPDFGLIQGLVVGLPAQTLFTRAFQFGMRHGMRGYTVGQAWWTLDCGPFWGHNAIIRMQPFAAHCELPVLPGGPPFGGHILSHDQVEATLLRRAGYQVRLQVIAGGSYEDNPPTVLDYVRRDLRWCQGNLQYVRLLRLPGLKPVSRFQLSWAILMFVGIPAWLIAVALLPLSGLLVHGANAALLEWLDGLFLLMHLCPKLVGYAHSLALAARAWRYGGRTRIVVGAAFEIVFNLMQSSITSFPVTLFIAGLLLGRATRWAAQPRDARRVSWAEAAAALWPQTVFGVWLHVGMAWWSPALLPWALPWTMGYLLAIPFAVLTTDPAISAWFRRHALLATPEELSPSWEVGSL